MKLSWTLFGVVFLVYGIYDIYMGITEIVDGQNIPFFSALAKIIVPTYIIGSSLYIIFKSTKIFKKK